MPRKNSPTYWCRIYLGGNYDDAVRVCRKYCNDVGLCVTVERCDYVYTGGMESGVVVGLINYPRFRTIPEVLLIKAETLAERLQEALGQDSYSIMTPEKTTWVSTRGETSENQK